ncbi:hypothetical protein B0G38_000851 [Arthrobacter sp. VKM Ac-2550]|nr:hypothetical protein [Arthrobacter sp. VKM Ac-2550]
MFKGMEQRIFRMARAGGIDTNPTTFMQRANTFASAATQYGTTTLLTRREKSGLNGYVIMPAEAARSKAALALAHTVGAKSEETQLPEDLGDTPVIGTLTFRPSPVLRETQNGIDPSEFPKLLANTMPEGSWVAASIRKPSGKERKHHTKWHNYRLGNANPQHHSYSPSAIMISVTAGGASQDEVRALLGQFTSGMPGFDLDTDVRFPKTKHSSWLGVPAGLLLAAATIFGLPQIPLGLPASTAPSLFAVAGLLLITGIAGLTGRMRSPEVKLRAKLSAAGFPPPPHRRRKPRPPHKEETIKRTINEGGEKKTIEKHIKAFDGDYPFAPDVFLVGPTVIVGMVSPHAGAISGETVSRERATPPAMLQGIGPLIGTNQDGSAYLSAPAQLFGTAIVGKPGSGKSVVTRTLFGWNCLERVAPCGRPGYPGRNNTLIAFESKGDGVAKYQAWAHNMGDRTLVIDVADPDTPGIDLFAVPGSNEEKALFFTNAMTYTFGKDAIGYRSSTTLKAVLTAALAVNDELIESIEGRDPAVIRTGMSPMYYAYLLLAGRSDKVGVELAEGIKARSVKLRERGNPDPVIEAGWAAIAFLYDGTTPSKRAGLVEAPFSKIEDLLALEQWWSPSRRKVTWDQIIEGHKSVIINTGTSATGAVLDDSVNHAISSLLMFSLQNALKRLTSGWLEQQRYVTIFADELSLLSGSSPEVIGWIRDQGRSYGIRAILATQRPEQLGPQLRSNFLTYATLISFSQTDVGTAQEIAANLGGHGEWTQEDIQFLEPFHVVIRSEVDQKRQSAFIVKLPNFEANMASYPAAQGYTEAAA